MPRQACFSSLRLHGVTGQLAEKVQNNWLIRLEERNPALLSMFRERDIIPYRDMLPWSGEFAGKHITGAYYIWRLTGDSKLYNDIIAFIDRFIACQAEDGYLGCFSKECRLTGARSREPEKIGESWDVWNHYHAMFGLLKWHEVTGNEAYMQCVLRMAELMLQRFYNGQPTLVSIGSSEMNLSVIHAFVLLYEKTGDKRYLDFARHIEGDLPDPNAGDYMRWALDNLEFYQCPKPRWESLHVIMGLAELYRATGEERYLNATRQIFFSILKTDVHNNGGFSTREQAIGNPYEDGPIETCCTVAYNAFGSQLMEIIGNLRIIDHLEKSHYNVVMGSFSMGASWSTYDTPMDGVRIANTQDINFQCRPGSPELNCCSVNAPRGLGQIYDWAVMQDGEKILLHCYEPMDAVLSDGTRLTIAGEYPFGGNVRLTIDSAGQEKTVALRIPSWSEHTTVTFRGEMLTGNPGEYLTLQGVFANEEVLVSLDYTVRVEEGALAREGKACLHAGPILYGFDAPDNPEQNLSALEGWTKADLLSAQRTIIGNGACLNLPDGTILRDFRHLGMSGSAYCTWLPVKK